MSRRVFSILVGMVFVLAAVCITVDMGRAQSPPATDIENPAEICKDKMRCITPQMREAAAARAAAARQSKQSKVSKQSKAIKKGKNVHSFALISPPPPPALDQIYFGPYPNYANSPGGRPFQSS